MMISHKYEDYADRLGIHALDALIAVLLWPTLVVIVLWWWRGMPTIFGGTPVIPEDTKSSLIFMIPVAGLLMWIPKKLKWFNIPFALDDPRRAMMYPTVICIIKLGALGMPLSVWGILAESYAPLTEPYKVHLALIGTGLLVLSIPFYVYRVIKLWKRTDLCPEADEEDGEGLYS